MATRIIGSQTDWDGGEDADGHRTYRLHVQTQGTLLDGPASHMQTPGLPVPGAVWAYDNDYDPSAWYTGERTVRGIGKPPCEFFQHVYTYTTRRDRKGAGSGGGGGKNKDDRGARKKCADVRIEDPLAEPPRIDWAGTREQREMTEDRFGNRLRTTSFEQLSGPLVTFDESGERVTIEQNLIDPQLDLVRQMVDTLNEATLWRLPARCWKLSDRSFSRKLYGACGFYYVRTLVFEAKIRYDWVTEGYVGGWDRRVPEISSTALNGKWWEATPGSGRVWVIELFKSGVTPDANNPNHYIPIPNPRGGGYIQRILSKNPASPGVPALNEDDEKIIDVEYYGESDFFELGVPAYID